MSTETNDRRHDLLQDLIKQAPTLRRVTAEIFTASGLSGKLSGNLYYNLTTGDYTLVNNRDRDALLKFRLQSVLYVSVENPDRPLIQLR